MVRPGADGHQPFREGLSEGGLPARVQVITRVAGELKINELFERDFGETRVERGLQHPEFGEGLRVSGAHRGLRLSQELHWSTVKVEGRELLRVARRVLVKIEQALFTAPEHVRLLALTHWGGLAKDESYELSLNMGWHHHRSFREGGKWKYFAWNTPYMFDADGPVSSHEGYLDANVHIMGLAEYTVLSWPRRRCAVMAAADPVEYLERGINLEGSGGGAQMAFKGWFEPTDVGAEYAAPWQHYYFLDQEDDPLVTSTTIWREGFAWRLDPYLQPESELEPWFATENLHGLRLGSDYRSPWDGDLTALEEHYAALRRDPLDRQIHPVLFHERPGPSIFLPDVSRYYDFVHQHTEVGRILINVPLRQAVGDLVPITCMPRLKPEYENKLDLGLEVRLTGDCFRFEKAAIVPFLPVNKGNAADLPPERLQVRQEGGVTFVRLEHSAAALQKDLAKFPGHRLHLEVRLRVADAIPAEAGVLNAEFLHRRPGETEYRRHNLTDGAEVTRGRFQFPAEPHPIRLFMGTARPGFFYENAQAYKVPNIFYEVHDGRPVRVPPAELVPRLAKLMRAHDVAVTTYLAAHGLANYDDIRNPNWKIPNAIALDQDRKMRKVWYTDGNRSDMLCPANAELNRLLEEGITRLLALGPFGVYFDELQANFCSCYARNHGHGLCQLKRQAFQRGDLIRQAARKAGYPEMYLGTEVGGLLQHTFAQGHNAEGVDPSRKDEGFEEIKRMLLGQLCYGFPGSRAFFNCCFHGAIPGTDERSDCVYGQALALAFPRFSLAPWSGKPSPIAYYFAAAVKKAFKQHYRYGVTKFPRELALPGGPPLETLALALESPAGLSVHFANLSGKEAVLSERGYSTALGHGCALLADSFGNCLGKAQTVKLNGADYLALDRPLAFGLWCAPEGAVYLRVLEADETELRGPAQVWISKVLLDRLAPGKTLAWHALDKESAATPVETKPVATGIWLLYPAEAACRCLRADAGSSDQ
jgi:hypothetical protein